MNKANKMRTVTFGMNISVGGYCDHTIFTHDQELYDYFTKMIDDIEVTKQHF